MNSQTETSTAHGLTGSWNWLIGGAVGGIVGSVIFGVVLWLVDPAIVIEAIPGIYGIDPGAVGWLFHLGHGLLIGIVFGFLVTRDPILGTITADVATDFIASWGASTRFALAGAAYGLAIWAVLPVIAQSMLMAFGGVSGPGFPVAAFESLVGHLLYGLLLGLLFSIFVDTGPAAAESKDPFEEPSESANQ